WVQRWAGPDRFLVQFPWDPAKVQPLWNAAGYQVMGGSFVTPFDRADYQAKAAPFAAARAKGPGTRPQPSPTGRPGGGGVRPEPGPPGAGKASPPPELPADRALEVWPEAFAATEAAVVPDGRSWVRYDLKTGKPIGQPVRLWPDTVADVGVGSGRLVALS